MDLLKLSATLALSSSIALSFGKEFKQPNIVFIFPDQLRNDAIGIWQDKDYDHLLPTKSDPVITPNLDKLYKNSVMFTQAYSINPVCSPYRAMLMSGMYGHENGVPMNCSSAMKTGLKEDITCFTDVLFANGYDTAYIGKAHWTRTQKAFDKDGNYVGKNGTHYFGKFDHFVPEGRGRLSNRFWVQTIGSNHFKHHIYSNQPALVGGKKDGEPLATTEYSPIHETNAVITYLKNENNERPKDKPFSVIWSTIPPHPAYNKREHCETQVYDKFFANKSTEELLVRDNVEVTKKNRADVVSGVYYSHIYSIDREVGRILTTLEEIGEADNTIVVFTSDHGEMLGSHGKMSKSLIYRESFLVPLAIYYPEKLKHRVEDLRISPIDLMPTLLGMVGLESKIPETVRGIDYSKAIYSNDFSETPKPNNSYYTSYAKKSRGVMTDKYTYIVYENGSTELYDNLKDPYQMTNINPQNINSNDLQELKNILGQRLIRSNDPWLKTKPCQDLINY